MEGRVPVITYLPRQLVTRANDSVDEGHWSSMTELIEAGLRTALELVQFDLDNERQASLNHTEREPHNDQHLLARPTMQPDLLPVDRPVGRLGWLTNRLGPIKIAVRTLANLSRSSWPPVDEFRLRAATAAQRLGSNLRSQDIAQGRRHYQRRWIGFPTGELSHDKGLQRFADWFALGDDRRSSRGPLAILGLAAVKDGRAGLTSAGWELACAPSPMLGEVDSHATLGPLEREILSTAVKGATDELGAVREFAALAHEASGRVGRIDKLLMRRHPHWSVGEARSNRAGIVGRLYDLGYVAIEGRGETAIVDVLPEGQQLLGIG